MTKFRAGFVVLAINLLVTLVTLAQMKSDPTGTWGGAMTTEAGTSGLELTLARDPSGWKATIKVRAQGQEIALPVQELQIKNADISFAIQLPRNLVKFAGGFAGDQLSGTVEVFQDAKKIRSGAFNLVFGGAMPALQQTGEQMADPNFNAKVDKPAYKKSGPKVLFDEAHHNFHTAAGRYKPFADLITNDGYQIVSNTQKFSPTVLNGYRILVISNALGAAVMADSKAANPAFTDAESDIVRDWVKAGGSLLLIADHAPMGSANQSLAKRFGVDMSKMYTTDEQHHDEESGNPGFIVYTSASGRLADHPVTRGRNDSERVNKIMTFTGQSLKGPTDSTAFLKLADTAVDAMPRQDTKPISASGRAQGIAIKFGAGRVIVLGEAGMLSAQLVGPRQVHFGMNRSGIDNRQLALNIMHWLSGLLKEK
jgi:hypothetical protein